MGNKRSRIRRMLPSLTSCLTLDVASGCIVLLAMYSLSEQQWSLAPAGYPGPGLINTTRTPTTKELNQTHVDSVQPAKEQVDEQAPIQANNAQLPVTKDPVKSKTNDDQVKSPAIVQVPKKKATTEQDAIQAKAVEQLQALLKKAKPRTNPSDSRPYGVLTYLRGGGKYVGGVIGLLESVQNQHMNNPVGNHSVVTGVVCHSSVPSVVQQLLQSLGHDVIVVEDAYFDPNALPNAPNWRIAMQKHVALAQTQYEKVIFIDSDAIVMKPLHPLFEYDNVAMAHDCGPDPFNSGVIVMTPGESIFRDFQHYVNDVVAKYPEKKRDEARRSSQRLLASFLEHENIPSSYLCDRRPCYKHFFYLDANCHSSGRKVLKEAIVVHFLASTLDIQKWSKPNVTMEFSAKHARDLCGLPLATTFRQSYFQALSRVNLSPVSIEDLLKAVEVNTT